MTPHVDLTEPQPTPHHQAGQPAIVDLVIDDLRTRKQIGISRYGMALQAHNGRDALRDLYEEISDALLYLRQVIEERDRSGCCCPAHQSTPPAPAGAREEATAGTPEPVEV